MNISRKLRCFAFVRAAFSQSAHIHRTQVPFASSTFRDACSTFCFNDHDRFFSASASRFLNMNRSDKKQTGRFSQKPEKGHAESRGHGTRAAVLEEELRNEKEKYLSMPIDRKRKIYKCGDDNYVTLRDIVTWPDYQSEGKKSHGSGKKSSKTSILAQKTPSSKPPKFPAKEKLNRKISLFRGDITTLEIDAIVNAANGSLMGGGGVDGAIHSAAGSFLKKECSTLNGCDTGDAKMTCGYKLPAKHVIHTVGPMGLKPDALRSAYSRCLGLVKENQLTSVAFPCISTGIYGYPNEAAGHVALEVIRNWLEKDSNADKVERIILCVFLKKDVDVYEDLLPVYFPLSDNGGTRKAADADKVSTSDSSSPQSTEEAEDNQGGSHTKSTADEMESDSKKGEDSPTTTDRHDVRGEEEEPMEMKAKEEKGKATEGKTKEQQGDSTERKAKEEQGEATENKEEEEVWVKADKNQESGDKRKSKGEVTEREEGCARKEMMVTKL